MSSEQSVNAETIEQTKQQIRGLVSEIAQLSKSDLDASEYYPAFLQRIVSALAAVGGAIWVLKDGRHLDLAYQINLSESLLDEQDDGAKRHFNLLNAIAATSEPKLVPPNSGGTENQAIGNPTRFLLVLAPMKSDSQVEGVVEIFQRPEAQPVTQRGYLKFLMQMCELAGEWLKTRKLRNISDRHSLWAQADHFARLVHDNLDLRDTAYTVVNEGRRIIGCDRVSVAIMHGGHCKVEAISGQDAIENRSNVATFLGKLATRVVATGESLWYDGTTEDLPPQVEDALDEYIDESHTKSMAVLPLRRPKREFDQRRTVTGEADDESNLANQVIGALIIEQIESDLPREVLAARADLVYEHTARALTNALDHNSIFLMPVWRSIGRMRWLVQARTLPKTIVVSAAILLLLLSLFIIRKDFNIQADGELQPVVKQDVFVPVDGDVVEVFVKDQDRVKQGDLLVKLRNTDLEVQFQDVLGQRQSKRERLFAVEYALLNQKKLTDVERIRLSGEAKELRQELETLEKQYLLLQKKHELLEIRSPIDGEIMMSWDVEKSLMRRPVTTGQVLMTVADPGQNWEVELHMLEHRSGHVIRSRQNEDWRNRYPGAGEKVTYVLATDPKTQHKGTIRDVKGITEVFEDKGQVVKMKVTIDRDDVGNPRPGASVTANVYCGRRSCGYVWFHEAWEWLQMNVFFKWF
jgi:hypothetical protein